MTEPLAHRRRNADYRWTRAKAVAFLRRLSATGSVAEAARAVGMSRQSAYRLRARLGPGFAAVWDEGLAVARAMRGAIPCDPQGYGQGDGQGDGSFAR